MSRVGRMILGVALALVAAWAAPPSADASEGTLSVQPGVVHPGESVKICGGGFSFSGDRVVTMGIDGLAGPHTTVESDGTACVVVSYSDFRRPYNRYVPLFLDALGRDGSFRHDKGRVFISDGRLPRTGAFLLFPAAVAGGGFVLIGILMVRRTRRHASR